MGERNKPRLVRNAQNYDRKKAEPWDEFGLKREYVKYSKAVRS
jgi:hypothetical protein